MIYNLVEYLDTLPALAAINFDANAWTRESKQASVLIMQSGGDPTHWYDRTDWRVQIMARNTNVGLAKIDIEAVYSVLKNVFHLSLPAVTVNTIVYPAIQTYQISPIQAPGFLGADDANLFMWSFNVTITTT